jgi:hypothetical protein
MAFLVALPLAAWCAVDAPQATTPRAATATPPPRAVPAPAPAAPVRKIDVRMVASRRHIVRANAEKTLKAAERTLNTAVLLRALQRRIAQWDELASCENHGDWSIVDRYGGGLGIFIGTWHAFGGDEFASNPGYATKAQQIVVAERIYARFGLSGWGCKVHVSWH